MNNCVKIIKSKFYRPTFHYIIENVNKTYHRLPSKDSMAILSPIQNFLIVNRFQTLLVLVS